MTKVGFGRVGCLKTQNRYHYEHNGMSRFVGVPIPKSTLSLLIILQSLNASNNKLCA